MKKGNVLTKALGLIIVLILWLLFIEYFANPYKKIQSQSSEDGSYYLRIYKFFYTKKQFDSLLSRLILENNDALSLNATAYFIEKDSMCWMVPIINQRCATFDSYPNDTTWITTLSDRKRESSKKMLYFPNGIYSCRNRLLAICEKSNEFTDAK